MPTLYLIRHGEPTLSGVLLGHTDPPLSERGRAQMAGVRIDTESVYASPLRRAHESATLCCGGARVEIVPELAEMSLGAWDGMSWSAIEAEYPDLARRKLEDWTGVVPPGGEPWTEFTARVDVALARILDTSESTTVVAHLTVDAWIAHRLSGADPMQFRQEYAEVLRFDF